MSAEWVLLDENVTPGEQQLVSTPGEPLEEDEMAGVAPPSYDQAVAQQVQAVTPGGEEAAEKMESICSNADNSSDPSKSSKETDPAIIVGQCFQFAS